MVNRLHGMDPEIETGSFLNCLYQCAICYCEASLSVGGLYPICVFLEAGLRTENILMVRSRSIINFSVADPDPVPF